MENLGYLKYLKSFPEPGIIKGCQITINGLERIVSLKEEVENSKRYFIAMSFNPSQKETRDSIKKAVKDAGYDPLLIDEIHHPSDITINDAMIAEIKKSKFLVADFTQQKHGVYFEAGYALGRGKPVIYCCKKTEFEKAHFDTNHYPHILYDNHDELYHGLKAKIEAWIE